MASSNSRFGLKKSQAGREVQGKCEAGDDHEQMSCEGETRFVRASHYNTINHSNRVGKKSQDGSRASRSAENSAKPKYVGDGIG